MTLPDTISKLLGLQPNEWVFSGPSFFEYRMVNGRWYYKYGNKGWSPYGNKENVNILKVYLRYLEGDDSDLSSVWSEIFYHLKSQGVQSWEVPTNEG